MVFEQHTTSERRQQPSQEDKALGNTITSLERKDGDCWCKELDKV